MTALITIGVFTAACSSTIPHEKLTSSPEASLPADTHIKAVVLLSDSTITFGDLGGTYVSHYRQIRGNTEKGVRVEIPIEEVDHVIVKGGGGGSTVVVFVILFPVIIAALIYVAVNGGLKEWADD